MGLCNSTARAGRLLRSNERQAELAVRRSAPVHEGEHAIRDLAPGLRDLVPKNAGAPAFSAYPELHLKLIKYRVKLVPDSGQGTAGGYELQTAAGRPLVPLERSLSEEGKTALVFRGKQEREGEEPTYWRVIIYDTSTLKASARARGHTIAGVVQVGVSPNSLCKVDCLYR